MEFSPSSSAACALSTASPHLRLALIAPDSLTAYATQLQQALLAILHAQKHDTEQSSAAAAVDTSLPLLDVVSLYIQLPEESTTDFIYRLQQGALPQHISLPHLASSHSLQHFDDDNDDVDDEADQQQQQEELEDEGRDEAEGEEVEEEDVRSWRVVDEAVPVYSRDWSSPSDEDSADEEETGEYDEDDEMPFPPLTPRHLRLHEDQDGDEPATVELLSGSDKEVEAVHADGVDPSDERKEADADREIGLSVLQTVQTGLARLASQHRLDEAEADETEATAHSARSSHTLSPTLFHSDLIAHDPPTVPHSSVPPLDLSRLLSSGGHHINLLLYDGVREDIAFSYFQFLQQLSTQLKGQSIPSPSADQLNPPSTTPSPSPNLYIPPTVLLLYNGWQILHRCESDEETEERIKKLLNLCDVVVVQDEELCAAYRQLCPTVEVIPHGYAQRCECVEDSGEMDRDGSVALSPLSSVSSTASTVSLASTASSASSLLFSSIPRAPVSSPACSPPLSPRLSTSPRVSLSSATSALSSFSSPDILSAVHRKRDRLHAPVVPFFSSAPAAPHSACNLASLISPSASTSSAAASTAPAIHVIGYIPTDDDTDESHSVSWPDVWQLHHALLDLTASSPTPPPPYLFFLHGAPITAAEEPFVVFLTASHLEQHYSGSYTDLHTFRQFLYSLSAEGRRVIVVYGMFVRTEVVSLCEQLLSFEVRVSRDVDDAGWVGGRMERSVPVVLELSNCLALRWQEAEMVLINRADKQQTAAEGADNATDDGAQQREQEPSSVCETEETFSPDSCPPSPRSLSTSPSSTTDSFSFSPSYHLYPSDKYDYSGAARQLLSLMQQPGAVEAALRRNNVVKREWSMDVVATMYLRLMQRELVVRGKGAGKEGAVVTQAAWYNHGGS